MIARVVVWAVGSVPLGVASIWFRTPLWLIVLAAWCGAAGWATARAATRRSATNPTKVGLLTALLCVAMIAVGYIGFIAIWAAGCSSGESGCPS